MGRARGGRRIPKLHATLAIADVDVERLRGRVGRGRRRPGRAREAAGPTWIAGGRARFTSAGCTLTLARGTGDTLTATVAAESCFNWASPGKVTLVREEAAPPAPTARRRPRPIERAVCADPGPRGRPRSAWRRCSARSSPAMAAASPPPSAATSTDATRAARTSRDGATASCASTAGGCSSCARGPASPFLPDGRPELAGPAGDPARRRDAGHERHQRAGWPAWSAARPARSRWR